MHSLFLYKKRQFLSLCFIIFSSAILPITITAAEQSLPKVIKESIPSSNISNSSGIGETKKIEYRTAEIEHRTSWINLTGTIILLITIILGLPWVVSRIRNPILFRKLKQKHEFFFKEICSGFELCSDYFDYLLVIFSSNKDEEICSMCNKLCYLLGSECAERLPVFLVKNGVRIITQKCKHKKEIISKSAFNCLSAFYKFSSSLPLDTFFNCFDELLNKQLPRHVRYKAIIEFCSFIKYYKPSRWEDKRRYDSLMKQIFSWLESEPRKHWNREIIILAKKCIESLEYIRDSPDIVNDLLPYATRIAGRQVNELINTYSSIVLSLDSSKPDQLIIRQILQRFEDWLKREDVDKNIMEIHLPRLINHLNPNRNIRPAFSRHKITRKVFVFPQDSPQDCLNGEIKDISKTGICFELECMLFGDLYQVRKSGDAPFNISAQNKTLKLSNVNIKMCEANGKDLCLEGRGELIRAWNAPSIPSSIPKTGFGFRFINGGYIDRISSIMSNLQ